MATADDVARLFLADIHAPITPANVTATKIWLAAENSNPTLRNNPWNLHSSGGLPGQIGSDYVGPGDRNVAVFSTIDAGVQANANNLIHLSQTNPEYGYGQVLNAFRAGDAVGALTALGNSAWSAGHYRVNNVPGTNSLVSRFTGTNPVPSATPVSSTSNQPGSATDIIAMITKVTGKSGTDILNATDIQKIVDYMVSVNPPSPFNNFKTTEDAQTYYHGIFDRLIGKAVNDTGNSIKDFPSTPFGLGGDNGFNLFGDIQSAVIFLGVVLVGIVFIGSGAIISLRKS